jgi:uncharacterized membrane protein (UPF0127 family)
MKNCNRIFTFSPSATSRLKNLHICLLFVFLFCAASCFGQGSQGAQKKLETRQLSITSSTGTSAAVVVRAELARTDIERERGLMFRRSLDSGDGMLFVFERDQILSFWMKNTLIPLSIAYIAHDGKIVDIFDMEPQNTSPIRSSLSVRYALEVPQHWFASVGIRTGDTVNNLP